MQDFPIDDYDCVLSQVRAVVAERDHRGRNAFTPFYETRCHGSQDMSGECWQRITRILGAEKIGDKATMLEDALDLVNESIFLVMHLKRELAQNASDSRE